MSTNLEDMFLKEFACECKFIRYCINQNTTLNRLLKARIKSTPLNPRTAKSVFRFHKLKGEKVRGKSASDKSTTKSLSKGIQHASIKR